MKPKCVDGACVAFGEPANPSASGSCEALSMCSLEAVRAYVRRGWRVVPIPRGQKAPREKDWPSVRLGEPELATRFSNGENVGLNLGSASGGLVDVDLDCAEARQLASAFLPPTELVHGRPSAPCSHYWYRTPVAPRAQKFADPVLKKTNRDRATIVELRSDGQQTVVPPSLHPLGEQLSWERDGEPGLVEGPKLADLVARLASAALLSRYWPAPGNRHDAALALAGMLLRAHWSEDATANFVKLVARTANDEQAPERARDAISTAKRLASGGTATGGETLANLVEARVVDQVRGWLDLRKVERARTADEPLVPYRATKVGLVWTKSAGNGKTEVLLTNFVARIAADVVEDDGSEQTRALEIEATLNCKVSRFTVTVAEFESMNWVVANLGAQGIVYPGSSLRDQARAAIQLLSGEIPTRTVFRHLGWRRLGAEWCYLHAGGAIGRNGPVPEVEVSIPDNLKGFSLPEPPRGDDLIRAIRASLEFLKLAPRRVTVPVYAAIWRAALESADFSLHLTARTGEGKTALVALAQQHFGAAMDARHLPGSWSSTGNALEGLAFCTKDALLVVDDFAPSGSLADIQRYHRDADRFLRAQGNRAGRQRMRADSSLRPAKPPRGLTLSTGEDVPRGQSLRARVLVIELAKDDVDFEKLTVCQRDAASGLYAQALAAFVRWVAGRAAHLREGLSGEVADLRERAIRSAAHRRTPEIIANLAVGLRHWLDFVRESAAITAQEQDAIWQDSWTALGEAAIVQASHQGASDPVKRFFELLASAMASGRAHVAGPDGKEPRGPEGWGWREVTVGSGNGERDEYRPQGARVGWVEGKDLFLDADAAYAAAQEVGRSLGESINLTPRGLHKQLSELGFLASKSSSRETLKIRRVLEGRRREVLHLRADLLVPETDQPDHSDQQVEAMQKRR